MRRSTKAIYPIILGLFLMGCSALQPAPTVTPLPSSTPQPVPTATLTPIPFAPIPEGRIILEISKTRKFAGTVYGSGKTAIILAQGIHGGGETSWDPFVQAVDKQKFTAVTFGYLQADNAGVVQAIHLVLDQLRGHGYQRIVCLGASLGVSACGSIAGEPEMVGIVLVAGPEDVAHQLGGDCHCANLNTLTYPKLYVAGASDPFAATTQQLYEQASQPKKLVLFEGIGDHATNLFYSSVKKEFLAQLIDFVNTLQDTAIE